MQWPGHWGNHVYQVMFVLTAAARHHERGLVPHVEAFRGSQLLQLSVRYPRACPEPGVGGVKWYSRYLHTWDWEFDEPPPPGEPDGPHVSVYKGFFQFNHSGYLPYRPMLQLHMRPRPVLEALLEAAWFAFLLSLPDDVLVVGVHIRHGDYGEKDCHPYCRAPIPWYTAWLQQMRSDTTVLDAHGRRPLQAAWEAQRKEKEAARLRYRHPSNAPNYFVNTDAAALCAMPDAALSLLPSTHPPLPPPLVSACCLPRMTWSTCRSPSSLRVRRSRPPTRCSWP